MAASVGLLCLSAGQARTEDLGQAMSQISQKIAPAAQNLKKSVAASAKNTPATSQMPAPTVENVIQQNGTIFIDNPNVGGIPFFAGQGVKYNGGVEAKTQIGLAKQLCKLMGYTEPVLSDTQWVTDGTKTLIISDDMSVAAVLSQVSTYCTRKPPKWDFPDKGTCEESITYTPAVFSRIGCKK